MHLCVEQASKKKKLYHFVPRLCLERFETMRVQAIILTFLVVAGVTAVQTTDRSLGTFIDCPSVRSADSLCRWAGQNGQVVDSRMLRDLLIQHNNVADRTRASTLRNLQQHMTYIEGEKRVAEKGLATLQAAC